ncbi:MAG: hypothetical protein ABF242_00680 [Flavobacteriales bacterium]
MKQTERNIKLIWDFRGEDGFETAKHHEIHLKQFAEKEKIPVVESGCEKLQELHSVAFITVSEQFMKIVRDALIPHRGEIAE